MNDATATRSDDALNLGVYLCLLALTAATVCASFLREEGRLLAITVALVIAGMKGSLIAFYYMGLRRERLFTWLVLGVGVLAVLILFIGIVPDVVVFPR